jgi:hypothetical protein
MEVCRAGRSEWRATAPGHHRLCVDNTWNWKTLEFDLAPGEDLKFRTVSRAGRFTWFLGGTLGRRPDVRSIERET